MFCEKCGNQVSEGDKFCVRCGNSLVSSRQATAFQTQSYEAPLCGTSYDMQENNLFSAPETKAQKKPISKKFIIGGSIGVGAIVLAVIALIIIIPKLNQIHLKDYMTIDFLEGDLYNGYAQGYLQFDNEEIEERYVSESKQKEFNLNDYKGKSFGEMLNQFKGDLSASFASVENITSHCFITAEIKGRDSEQSTDMQNRIVLENLKSDDIINVKLEWEENIDTMRSVQKYEKQLGISFDKSDEEFEIKVSDILEKEGIELEEPVEADLLEYIEREGLVKTEGYKNGELGFTVEAFEYEVGGYRFSYEGGNYGSVRVVDVKTDESVSKFYWTITSYSFFSDGDKVKITLPTERIYNTPIVFKSIEKEYTIVANSPLTLEEAKSNIKLIENAFKASMKAQKQDDIDIQSVYFASKNSKASEEYYYDNIIVIVNKEPSARSDKERYVSHYINNPYLCDGELCFKSVTGGYIGQETLKDLQKYDIYLSSEGYDSTKIK